MQTRERKKFSKQDIGTPSDFRHVRHIGWDPQDEFTINDEDTGKRKGQSRPIAGAPPSLSRGAPPPPPPSRGAVPPKPPRIWAPPSPPSPPIPVDASLVSSPVSGATPPSPTGIARYEFGPPPLSPLFGDPNGTTYEFGPLPLSPDVGDPNGTRYEFGPPPLSPDVFSEDPPQSRLPPGSPPSRRVDTSPPDPLSIGATSVTSPTSVRGPSFRPPPGPSPLSSFSGKVLPPSRGAPPRRLPPPPLPPSNAKKEDPPSQRTQQRKGVKRDSEDKRNSVSNVEADENWQTFFSLTEVDRNENEENKTPCPSPISAGVTFGEEKSVQTSLRRSESFPSYKHRTSVSRSSSLSRKVTTLPHQTTMKRGLSKADLGHPSDFQHIAHIGWDPRGGFDVHVNDVIIDEDLEKAFSVITTNVNRMQVPPEILSRGPEAENAYREALKNGQVEVYRGRIMLIGQDRAGKTSLKKSLLGLSFDPNEESTDGVVVDPSTFRVDVDDVVDWQKTENRGVKDVFEKGVAGVMAEMLSQSRREKRERELTQSHMRNRKKDYDRRLDINNKQETKKEKKEATPMEGESIAAPSTSTDTFTMQQGPSNATDQTGFCKNGTVIVQDDASASNHHVVEASQDKLNQSKVESKGDDIEVETVAKEDVGIPELVMKNLIERLSARNLDSSEGQETTITIWDLAGQQLYYASHPVFFSHRAIYVLVYNLEKDLPAEAEPCVRQGVNEIRLDNYDNQTNLDALLSWLVSIHSARPAASDDDKKREKLPYVRPPVIIVGTHADCPFEEPKKMEQIIQNSLISKSYTKHVVRPFITVDNTLSSDDDGIKKLKDKVKELFDMEPYMGEKVPVRWFKFEKVIKSLVEQEEKSHMSLKDVERLIEKVCNIEDKKEMSALLNFYHDLGVIVKHGNTVILKAEWLVDLFRKLITIKPFNEQNPINSGYWKTLEETGILDMALVEHVFKEQINCGETKDDILGMMENYGLIARFGGSEDPNSFHYFVPAQLKSSPKAFFDVGPSMADPCTLYLHFPDGFIPHGLYSLLVSGMITWCSKKGYPYEPNLFQSVSRFFVGRTYGYELYLMRRKRFVKVVLRSLRTERSWVFQPVAFQIREFLESFLKDVPEECPWYQSLNYQICVRCPSTHATKCERHQLESCIDDDCLHLLPIENNRELVCRESIGEESKPNVLGLEEWYREHPRIPVLSEEGSSISSFSVSATFDLSDDQKRWLVIGICLNKILLPVLRSFIEPKIIGLYAHLKATHNIDTQCYHGRLTSEGKCNSLNYGSINSNEANHGRTASLYDCSVHSAVDLAKLYLKPYMAKFLGFDDTCDISAALGILSSASAFSPDVQDLSSKVRNDVRNEWGHCNFSVWDEAKFTACFKLMDSLVKALSLGAEEEKIIADELQEWEDKGVQLCMGKVTEYADLVKFIEFSDAVLDRLIREMRHLENRQDDETHRVTKLKSDFEKYKDSINKRIESLEQRMVKKFESQDRELKAIQLAITKR